MSRKEIMIQLGIVSLIFLIGFLMRIETVNPNSPNDQFFQDQNGLPYMYEMDSYYNYRLTQNYLEHGYLGDVKIEGIEWDMHSYYPPGVPLDYPPMIVYLTGFVFYFVNLISEIPLLVVSFWLPAFIAPLAGVIVYLMLRRYTNDYGALAGGFLMVLVPYYFLRTVPGWFDTDMFTILLPLIVVWLFMESINSETSRKAYLLVLLSSFFMFLFSTAWNGWQLYFYLIVIYSIFYIIWLRLKNRSVKKYLHIFITFSAVSILLITVFSGYLNIIKLIYGPLDLLKVFGAHGTWSPWPDSYIAVSEMERPSLEKIVSGLGLSLLAGILGLIVNGSVFDKKKFQSSSSQQNGYEILFIHTNLGLNWVPGPTKRFQIYFIGYTSFSYLFWYFHWFNDRIPGFY
jgi:dolichyl-diphosphooligosaccharide--protein glycosyltransferase